MLEYDPKANLQHYPGFPMRRFGLNPYGEPLYRIVFAASRRNLASFPGDPEGFHWTPTYSPTVAAWVLERWCSPFEYCQMSKAQWDRELAQFQGPYPSRGEYSLAWQFDLGVTQDGLDKIIGTIEASRKRSQQDLRDFHSAEYAAEEKQRHAAVYGEIRESYSAFGKAPMAGYGGGRGTKTAPPMLSANELGLPIPGMRPNLRAPGARRTSNVRDIQTRHTVFAGAA
jgi:hypothetical protein